MKFRLSKQLVFAASTLLITSCLHRPVVASKAADDVAEDDPVVIRISNSPSDIRITGIGKDQQRMIMGTVQALFDTLPSRVVSITSPVLSVAQVVKCIEQDAQIQTKLIGGSDKTIPEEVVKAALKKRASGTDNSPRFSLSVGSHNFDGLRYFVQLMPIGVDEQNTYFPSPVLKIINEYAGNYVLDLAGYTVGDELMSALFEGDRYNRPQSLFYKKFGDDKAAPGIIYNPIQEMALWCRAIKVPSLKPKQLVQIIEKVMFDEVYLDKVQFETNRPIAEKYSILRALKNQTYVSFWVATENGTSRQLHNESQNFIHTTLYIKGKPYFAYRGSYQAGENPLINSWLQIYGSLLDARERELPVDESEIEKMQGYKLDWE